MKEEKQEEERKGRGGRMKMETCKQEKTKVEKITRKLGALSRGQALPWALHIHRVTEPQHGL